MNHNIKFLLFIALIVSLAVTFAFFVSAEVYSGHIEYTYNDATIVDNDWTLDSESGLLTIKSIPSNNWNECGTGSSQSFDKYGGWSKYKLLIKKVVLVGNFRKISHNAFNGCTNLVEVVMTENVGQIDAAAFKGCSSLTTICVDTYLRIEGMADIRNVPVLNNSIFEGTQIKSVFTSEGVSGEIKEKALPDTLIEIFGKKGSVFEEYANSNGIKFTERLGHVNVDIYIGNDIYNSYSLPFGMSLSTYGVSGNGCAICVFEDMECTKVFDIEKNLTDNLKIYAKEILRFDGWSVRTKEYHGLRAVFEYNMSGLGEDSDVVISRVGAIAGKYEYALNDFTVTTEGAKTILVYEYGQKVGITLGDPENNKVKYAISAVGFEGSDEEFASRAMQNIVFRGFIEVENTKSGDKTVYYTDAIGSTLAFVSGQYLKSDASNILTEVERSFVSKAPEMTAGKGQDARYDKETLMELLTEIYNDNTKLLVGEEIDSGGKTANDVLASYMEKAGQKPSILGMDLACYGVQLMTATEEYRTEFLRELIDYCRDGGVITASSHFGNPTGIRSDCRGYLGKEEIWEDLLTDGTTLNRLFKRELNVDSAFLRELQNNDIPILWRPFHEMNGNWFWWCIKQENDYLVMERCFHDMWKYVYDYYENELNLTNLIWVYSPNNDTGSLVDVEYCYPGDEYVDMTGLDWYTSGGFEIGSDEGAYLRMMDYGMPTALTEYGSSGKLDSIETWEDIQKMYQKGMKLTYILTWTSGHSFPSCGKVDELMAKPDILSLDEVFALFKAKE
ncbi:MAG: leucine-rich repeat protein [Clostridia bacterium]|nr:leucine-rich repeat protein [Clostridia bacterium]